MISILSSISELERSRELRAVLQENYIQAIKSAAQYAVELDGSLTGPHRRHLAELADQAASNDTDVLTASRATFGWLLHDYRDKAARYLQRLRDELTSSARALQETLDSLTQATGDHEMQLRRSVGVLRDVSREEDIAVLRAKVRTAADAIEISLEQARKEHQLTTSQFLSEIRVLHQRIDSLEAAASIDRMSALCDRGGIEEHIRSARAGSFHLLLFQVRGLSRAGVQFGRVVSEELAGAFSKRVKSSLPDGTILARWSTEEFIAMVAQPRDPKSPAPGFAAEQLSGAYACQQSGKTIRPSLQVSVGVVDSAARETAERILMRVKMFLTGGE